MSEQKYLRETPCGTICGTDCQWPGVAAYKGIRYATAERWAYPEAVTHWDGVYEATAYGACCYQLRSFYNEADMPEKAFYYKEFRLGETYTYSENCLFLNIWTPADAGPESKLPVIFYIHGGGFSGGAVMGAGLILYLNAFGFQKTERFFTYRTFRWITFLALMTYAALKSYSFYPGANHIESGIPLGTPGAILSGFILPLNICVGLIVMCTMYAFYTLFRKGGM